MTASHSVRNTVPVNGDLLREARIRSGYSQEALIAACKKSFHIGTLRRAERSEKISTIYLDSISEVLNEPTSYFIADSKIETPSQIDLTGEWASFFVQDHPNVPAYVVQEITTFETSNRKTSGFSESEHRGVSILESYENIKLRGDLLTGTSIVEGWGDKDGFTSYQLVISRANDWMDGFVQWYDLDWRDIRISRYILVRRKSRFFDAYLADANRLMSVARDRFEIQFSNA